MGHVLICPGKSKMKTGAFVRYVLRSVHIHIAWDRVTSYQAFIKLEKKGEEIDSPLAKINLLST